MLLNDNHKQTSILDDNGEHDAAAENDDELTLTSRQIDEFIIRIAVAAQTSPIDISFRLSLFFPRPMDHCPQTTLLSSLR